MKRDLLEIPGVGKQLKKGLLFLGYTDVDSLRGADPEQMYQRLCNGLHETVDRCVLYVYREAVYYAEHEIYDPELLKWWNWKDEK